LVERPSSKSKGPNKSQLGGMDSLAPVSSALTGLLLCQIPSTVSQTAQVCLNKTPRLRPNTTHASNTIAAMPARQNPSIKLAGQKTNSNPPAPAPTTTPRSA